MLKLLLWVLGPHIENHGIKPSPIWAIYPDQINQTIVKFPFHFLKCRKKLDSEMTFPRSLPVLSIAELGTKKIVNGTSYPE